MWKTYQNIIWREKEELSVWIVVENHLIPCQHSFIIHWLCSLGLALKINMYVSYDYIIL